MAVYFCPKTMLLNSCVNFFVKLTDNVQNLVIIDFIGNILKLLFLNKNITYLFITLSDKIVWVLI